MACAARHFRFDAHRRRAANSSPRYVTCRNGLRTLGSHCRSKGYRCQSPIGIHPDRPNRLLHKCVQPGATDRTRDFLTNFRHRRPNIVGYAERLDGLKTHKKTLMQQLLPAAEGG